MAERLLKRIKWIDQKSKDIVTGYNREFDKDKKYIPKSVSNLCLLFYSEYDCFIKCGDALSINNKGDTVTGIYATICPYRPMSIARGLINIDTSRNKNIYSWTFKIINRCINEGVDDRIGIGLYDGSKCKLFYSGCDSSKGSIIKMEFNLKEQIVRWFINDAYNHRNRHYPFGGRTYNMAISFAEKDTAVQ